MIYNSHGSCLSTFQTTYILNCPEEVMHSGLSVSGSTFPAQHHLPPHYDTVNILSCIT